MSSHANNRRFNAEALEWDNSPVHHITAKQSFQALLNEGLISDRDGKAPGIDALEIGCGTGLLTFLVRPHVRSIIAVDTAAGMIDVFNSKLQNLEKPAADRIRSVCTLFTDVTDAGVQDAAAQLAVSGHQEAASPKRFNLILSLLTMHHIADHVAILKTMFTSLRPGGKIALVDFEDFGPDAMLFHPKEKYDGVEHHGIKRDRIEKLIQEAGFVGVKVTTAFTLSKEADRHGTKEAMLFPFLLCVGAKAGSD